MLKILIAEDEEAIAKLIKLNLSKAGYQCSIAPDGEKAANRMMNEFFDLILLDIMLPGIDGYELMEYANKLGYPVIFLTALGTTEHKVKGLKMGADDYEVELVTLPDGVNRAAKEAYEPLCNMLKDGLKEGLHFDILRDWLLYLEEYLEAGLSKTKDSPFFMTIFRKKVFLYKNCPIFPKNYSTEKKDCVIK